MSKSPYGPFNQIDFPRTSQFPPGSSFDALMPVDLKQDSIQQAVLQTIPNNLEAGLTRHGAITEYSTRSPVSTYSVIRELGLGESLDPSSEARTFQRRQFIITALSQRGVKEAYVHYITSRGELLEYSVDGASPHNPYDITELFASVNLPPDSNDEYHIIDRPAGMSGEGAPLAIDNAMAIDFMGDLAERHTGLNAPEDELALLTLLYEASPHRARIQEGDFFVECRTGIKSEIDARLQTIYKGRQIIRSYSLTVANELPSGDSVTMAIKVDPPKGNKRIYPKAKLAMTSTGNDTTPETRAATFNSLLEGYRDHPEIFIDSLTNAALCLAESEPEATA